MKIKAKKSSADFIAGFFVFVPGSAAIPAITGGRIPGKGRDKGRHKGKRREEK